MSTPADSLPMQPFPASAGSLRQAASDWLAARRHAVVVQVAQVQGSTPRDTDARMLVSETAVLGTIGGGHLEWQAIAAARDKLAASPDLRDLAPWQQRFALGPTLGQCCGGTMVLQFKPLVADTLKHWPALPPRFHLDLHGAGHVGQAIVQLLCGIDCHVRWIDQRFEDDGSPGAWPTTLPGHIQCLPTDDAVAETSAAPWGAHHLVITHRHDLDLALVDALLRREDIREGQGWLGMIGSRSKRAAFEHRLLSRGHGPDVLPRLVCPIGIPGIAGKSPQVIAVAVVAQLLQRPAQTIGAPPRALQA